jgi:thiosulfate/3-mercaptopyruvate sulfurtransferase
VQVQSADVTPTPLTTPEELSAVLHGSKPPLLLDVRPAHAFASGQLPGAVHLDVWGISLIDTDPAPLRAFLWIIQHLLALRGVANDRPVVVYEDDSGVRAARVFWFLEFFGHPDVRVLDGGVRAWTGRQLPLSREPAPPTASEWTGTWQDSRLATWQDVEARLGRADVAILDARTDGEFCGTTVRAARGGRIPGAIHVEWTENLGDDGRFRSPGELRRIYERAGVTPDREVIAYCQGGYRAAHSYHAHRVLGYPRVRNYLGSWKEWGDRAELSISR